MSLAQFIADIGGLVVFVVVIVAAVSAVISAVVAILRSLFK